MLLSKFGIGNTFFSPSITVSLSLCQIMVQWLTSCDRKFSVTHTGTEFLSLSFPHISRPQTSPVQHRWLSPLYYTIASWGQRTSTEVCPEAFLIVSCLHLRVCSTRTDGSRWSTARHAAAAGGLGGFSLCSSFGSTRPWAARSHAGQDGAERCSHEAQQPTRPPTDAPFPNDGQWWEPSMP